MLRLLCGTLMRLQTRWANIGAASHTDPWDQWTSMSRSTTHADRDDARLINRSRSSSSHTYGITALSFYPFDSLAFLSSSYDHTLKIYSSETLTPSASFSLGSVVYSHSISPIASHLLVACATQHPSVRLVDLRSAASTHSLAGHGGGAVLSVAWSPKHEHILASGASDGTVRFWDVRRSAATLGVLDMEDSVGVAGHDGLGRIARRRERGRAHNGLVNGLIWTEDGRHVVTGGHDERIRVWDTVTGANTLANFGPIIKNPRISTLWPALAPRSMVRPGDDFFFYPNEREILMYELFEGRLLKRLRPVATARAESQERRGHRNLFNRVTALCWRPHNMELLSAHTDGTIRSWQPRTTVDAMVEEAEADDEDDDLEDSSRKRKRQVLEDIHRDLTKPKVTFT